MNEFYDQEDEQNVEDYWQRLKDSGKRPALQDEARWTWHQTGVALRAVVRGDLELWEAEIEDWWNGGCKS